MKLGRVGSVVYGRNRHGQTQYQLVIPANPRTEPQQANRGKFGGTASEWRQRTEAMREAWKAEGPKHRSRKRLGPGAPLSGYNYFVQVNARRAARGLPLLEWPPGWGVGAGSVGAAERVEERAGRGRSVRSGVQACWYGVATVVVRCCYGILREGQRRWARVETA